MSVDAETLKKLSNEDLHALANDDYQKISDEGLKILSGEKSSGLKNTFLDVQKREAKGFVQGVADFGTDLGNLYIRASNGLGHLVDPKLKSYTGRVPRASVLTPEEEQQFDAKAGKFFGEMIPSFMLPQLRAATLITKSKPAVTALKNFFARNLPRVVDSGINSGIQNAVFNAGDEQKSLPESFATGAALGGALHAGVGLPSGMTENYLKRLALKAKKGLSGLRTPEQLAVLHEKLGAVPASLNKALGVSTRWPAKFLSAMPFSGVSQKANVLQQATKQQAHALLQTLLNDSHPDKIQDEVMDALRFNRNAHTDKAQHLFNQLNLRVENAGVKIHPLVIRQTVKKLLKENDKALFPSLGAEIKRALIKIKDNKRYSPSFTELHFTHADLDQLTRQLQHKGEQREAAQILKLQDAIHQDMQYALEQSGKPELMADWRKARSYFKDNVVPYRHRYFYQVLDKQKMTGLLANKLLSHEHQKVFEHLSPEMKSKLAYLHFSKLARRTADELHEFDSEKLASAYQKMNPTVREKLLTKNQKKEFDRLLALHSVMPKVPMSNQNLSLLRTGEVGGLGYLLGGKVIAPMTLGTGLIGNRLLMNYFHSPKAREAYIRQQLGNPKQNARVAKYLSAPINYLTAESK